MEKRQKTTVIGGDNLNCCDDLEEHEHFGRYINHLSRLIRTACNTELSRCGADATGEQCRLIGYISHREKLGEEVFQRDIERDFGIRRSSAASILSHLERGGYIERFGDPADGRLKRVVLTAKGREFDRTLAQNIGNIEELISRGMSEEEKAEFMRLIKLAMGNLAQNYQRHCTSGEKHSK